MEGERLGCMMLGCRHSRCGGHRQLWIEGGRMGRLLVVVGVCMMLREGVIG